MGKTIEGAERNLVLKVIRFFENEKKHGSFILPVDQAIKRACAATGLSKTTIMKIKKEARIMQKSMEARMAMEESDEDQPSTSLTFSLKTPGKNRKKYKTKVDNFDIKALCNLVDNFYETRKDRPTLKKILAAAKQELNFPGQKDTLRRILIDSLGYTFEKCRSKGVLLIKSPDIAKIDSNLIDTDDDDAGGTTGTDPFAQ